jgi:hypothetical protein
MKFQAKTGHLSHGSLHLKQSEQGRKKMGKGNKVKFHLQQLKPAALNWKGK